MVAAIGPIGRIILILMVGIAFALASNSTQAGEPTPTPTPAPSSIPTPLPAGSMSIRVVEDANGDGIEQSTEPGLTGWTVLAGCGDAIQVLTTDADGYASLDRPDCLRVERRFGWLPTTPLQLTIVQLASRELPVRFLLQNLGPNVMELRGEAIDAGLAATSPFFETVAPPFLDAVESCVQAFVEENETLTSATAIVIGSGNRAGCPTPGASFSVVMNGATAATTTFSPGTTAGQNFVVGGDSMRLYLQDVDGAIVITGVSFFNYDCAVILPVTGFGPEGSVRVFVLSHEAKSGCAGPGNTIIFTRNGNNLFPFVPWEPGTPEFSPPLQLMERIIPVDTGTDVVPPETGSAGLK